MQTYIERETPATLLLVDDEPNVLRSLERCFSRSNYRILTAENGDRALSVLQHTAVDLILSDARMPGIDGASLLSTVRVRWPNCMRILLTGYPDVETMIKAINEGEIHRYIAKPWNDAELRVVIEQSLAFQYARQEHDRLQRVTQQQNRELMAMTAELERRVAERTASLQKATHQLSEANTNLERSFVTATEVFSSLIHQRLPQSRRTNREVLTLARKFCAQYEVPNESVRNLEMAAALYNLGRLTWRDGMIALPVDRLAREDRALYQRYPSIGESLLLSLDPAQDAATIIRHHQERWDGKGYPDQLMAEDIPWGSRLLKILVDFVEYQKGMLVRRQLSPQDALRLISESSGRLYDPQICAQFIELAEAFETESAEDASSVRALSPLALTPGMKLAQPLYTSAGVLMLNKDKKLTERLIERLQQFEQAEGQAITIYIRDAEEEIE